MKKIIFILSFLILSWSVFGQLNLFMLQTTVADNTIRYDTLAQNYYGNGSPFYYGNGNWNHVHAEDISTSLSSLKYFTDGSNSGYAVSISNTNADGVVNNGAGYCTSPTDGFPDSTHRYGFFTSGHTVTFTGLDNTKSYDYVILGTRGTATHSLTITSQSKTDTWDAGNNCSVAGKITGLTPSSGTIVITVSINSGAFAYLNADYLIQH